MLQATEINHCERAAGKSRMERLTNEKMSEIKDVKHTIVEDNKEKQLLWFGHVQRMTDLKIP